jgi:hypothetical protein
MPHFEPFYEDKLRGGLGRTDADAILDLTGAPRPKAEASLDDMLERSRFTAPKTVAILLDGPPDGGGETLFQPVGRRLLAARKRGWITRLQTLPARDGLGFYVALAGRPPGRAEAD